MYFFIYYFNKSTGTIFPAVLVLENFSCSLCKYIHILVWLVSFYELSLLLVVLYLQNVINFKLNMTQTLETKLKCVIKYVYWF